MLLNIRTGHLLRSSTLQFRTYLVTRANTYQDRFLLTQATVIGQFFPLITRRRRLLLRQYRVVVDFFPSLLRGAGQYNSSSWTGSGGGRGE